MGDYSHSEGRNTQAIGNSSHTEGQDTIANSNFAHAEGYKTEASGSAAHAEGGSTKATNETAHAEGQTTIASGKASHAEGRRSIASGNYSHAEGDFLVGATRYLVHHNEETGLLLNGSEGLSEPSPVENIKVGEYVNIYDSNNQQLLGNACITSLTDCYIDNGNDSFHMYSIAFEPPLDDLEKSASYLRRIYTNVSSGIASHVEGMGNEASAKSSHVEGCGNIAKYANQHVQGQWNKTGNFAHIIGGGTETDRKNIHTIDWDGNAIYAGEVTASNGRLISEEEARALIPEQEEGFYHYNLMYDDSSSGPAEYFDYILIYNKWPKIVIDRWPEGPVGGGTYWPSYTQYMDYGDGNTQTGFDLIFSNGQENLFIHEDGSFYITPALTNPSGIGSFSLNRKADTTIGDYSAAIGNNATASGRASLAEGLQTTALGAADHAEGYNTIANGGSTGCAHAEGHTTQALAAYSHAEGQGTITSTTLSG